MEGGRGCFIGSRKTLGLFEHSGYLKLGFFDNLNNMQVFNEVNFPNIYWDTETHMKSYKCTLSRIICYNTGEMNNYSAARQSVKDYGKLLV